MTSRFTQAAIWRAMREHMPDVHWTRIETTTGNGVPDVEGCYEGVAVWIEIKSIIEPCGRIDLTPVQVAWLRHRADAGGRSYILAADTTGLWIWKGRHAAQVKALGIRATPLYYASPWPPSWARVQQVLFSKEAP